MIFKSIASIKKEHAKKMATEEINEDVIVTKIDIHSCVVESFEQSQYIRFYTHTHTHQHSIF